MFKFSSNVFKIFHLKIVYRLAQYYIQYRQGIYFNMYGLEFSLNVCMKRVDKCVSRLSISSPTTILLISQNIF